MRRNVVDKSDTNLPLTPHPHESECGDGLCRDAASKPADHNMQVQRLRLLTFSTLYPSAARPNHGIFVENRLRHLVEGRKVTSTVIAPVPWFPFKQSCFGSYSLYAKTPAQEVRHGISVLHPRFPIIPKVGMSSAPALMAASVLPLLKKNIRTGHDFDVIDAHYFYPDGVAAVALGKALNKPVVITARGTDLNLVPQYQIPRRLIRWAADNAAGLVAVCQALKDVLVEMGVPSDKVSVLRNGVDLNLFYPPQDRSALRRELGMAYPTLLSVGELTCRKGHDLVIRAMAELPDAQLRIIGQGPERAKLERLVATLHLSDRVAFLGALPHEQLRHYYGAADALILASSREGWANVLLEAMACGTPAVASAVWGTPEVITAPEAGLLCDRTPTAIAEAVKRLLGTCPDRAATRRYAEKFDWENTSTGQLNLFTQIVSAS